jgi:hypothetical protein
VLSMLAVNCDDVIRVGKHCGRFRGAIFYGGHIETEKHFYDNAVIRPLHSGMFQERNQVAPDQENRPGLR